jgi:hypothetical protein
MGNGLIRGMQREAWMSELSWNIVKEPNKGRGSGPATCLDISAKAPSGGKMVSRDSDKEAADKLAEDRAAAGAVALFGEQAAVAVAYCGLEAWFEGNKEQSRQWGKVLRRLANQQKSCRQKSLRSCASVEQA